MYVCVWVCSVYVCVSRIYHGVMKSCDCHMTFYIGRSFVNSMRESCLVRCLGCSMKCLVEWWGYWLAKRSLYQELLRGVVYTYICMYRALPYVQCTYIPYSGKLLREKTFTDHFRGMLNHSFVSIGGCGMHKISWRKLLLWVALKLQNSSPSKVPAIWYCTGFDNKAHTTSTQAE